MHRWYVGDRWSNRTPCTSHQFTWCSTKCTTCCFIERYPTYLMNKTHFNFHVWRKQICPYSLVIDIHTSVRLFGSRSRPTSCRSWPGPICLLWLFADDKSHPGQDYPHGLISVFAFFDQSKLFVKTLCNQIRLDKLLVLIGVQTVHLGCQDASQE